MMRIYVNEIKVNENQLKCYTEEDTSNFKEAGQVIVDSDNYAFVVLLDDGEAFSYLMFVQETWDMLHKNRDKEIIINDTLKLNQFHEEMDYLLANIQGNSNYGKDFVAKVEEIFELE